jgi:hypothetical protein
MTRRQIPVNGDKELIEKQTQRKSLYSWQKTAEQIQGIVQSI